MIYGIEKITSTTIVMTGRQEHIDIVLAELGQTDKYVLPSNTEYYEDYQKSIELISASLNARKTVIITQSKEYLDCLLASDLEFDVITVRSINNDIYLRCLSKEAALENRKVFNMELRK